MAHRPNIDQNFSPAKVTLGGISPQAITLCLYRPNDRMFMLFFADVSNFARPPFKTRRSHLNDI